MRYAENTGVSADRSRAEIERTLTRYGADQFMYAWQDGRAVIGFRMHKRFIKFVLPMPDREQFRSTPGGRRKRNDAATLNAWEQATRQRWRALAIAIKAKLEAVESGIAEFDGEFMNYIVMPDGKTIGEHVTPQIEASYLTGKMVRLLPAM